MGYYAIKTYGLTHIKFYLWDLFQGVMMSELKIVDTNKLMDMNEASALLGLKKSTLYAIVMRKQITHIKLGKLTRFRPEDIQAFISKNLVEERKEVSYE